MRQTLRRILISYQNAYVHLPRYVNNSSPITKGRYGMDQMDFIKSAITNDSNIEWPVLKQNALDIPGSVNQKNIDGVLFKLMVNNKRFDAALSFAEYLKKTSEELNIGSINGILALYFEMGKENKLPKEHKAFILDMYEYLYSKYKVLDFASGERLVHALCVIDEWKKALKVLDDITLSSKPSHSAYNTLISTLFRNNKKGEAMKLIEKSMSNDRQLSLIAYEAWINYILRKYKENQTKLKYLDDVCQHIYKNSATINKETANKFKEVYTKLGWDANDARIRKGDGLCSSCNQTLDCLKLTDNEFQSLQRNIKEKLIVGSDLFLKTSPGELDRFLTFYKETAPYDVVLDALNIAYIARNGSMERVSLLNRVADYFARQNKKMLLLGRKHMLRWPKRPMAELMGKTCSFFTEDLSQDDPYFITAAILSGSHTDIVSKDLLRGHRFVLHDEHLRLLFRRWQWQHQWMVFISKKGKVTVQAPLKFTPCAQKNKGTWHIPYESEEEANPAQVNDGIPDLSSWLCIRPKANS